jgi:hypothetical protein
LGTVFRGISVNNFIRRGEATTGLKAELAKRLQEVLDREVSLGGEEAVAVSPTKKVASAEKPAAAAAADDDDFIKLDYVPDSAAGAVKEAPPVVVKAAVVVVEAAAATPVVEEKVAEEAAAPVAAAAAAAAPVAATTPRAVVAAPAAAASAAGVKTASVQDKALAAAAAAEKATAASQLAVAKAQLLSDTGTGGVAYDAEAAANGGLDPAVSKELAVLFAEPTNNVKQINEACTTALKKLSATAGVATVKKATEDLKIKEPPNKVTDFPAHLFGLITAAQLLEPAVVAPVAVLEAMYSIGTDGTST